MDLRQLRSFVVVVEQGSINRAAARLHCAQPTLSAQMRQLEKTLGVSLLRRRSRGVETTPAGQQFYGACLEILGQVEHARGAMQEWARDVAGPVAAGIIPSIAKEVLPPVLRAYCDEFPHVDMRIVEAYSGTLTDWVMSGELDFALVTEPTHEPALVRRVVASAPLCLVSGRMSPLVTGARVSLSRLPPIKLVLPSPRHSLRTLADRLIERGDLRLARLMEIDGLYATLQFVRNSDWTTLSPLTTMAGHDREPGLSWAVISRPLTRLDYYLIHQQRRPPSRSANLLIERLLTALRAA